jgi:hypothetical protein
MEYLILDIPELLNDENNDDSDSDDDKWHEINEEEEITDCLFCPSQFSVIEKAIEHLKSDHQFDLIELKSKYSMDSYSFIKVRRLIIVIS